MEILTIQKQPPGVLLKFKSKFRKIHEKTYCNYKHANEEVFINDLSEYFTENVVFLSFDLFKRTIDKTLRNKK